MEQPLDYNHQFTSNDIDQLIDELNNNQITNEQLMHKYNVRCIYVNGKKIRTDLLNTVYKRKNDQLIHFFWTKLVYDDQYRNLVNLDTTQIVRSYSYFFVLNYFLLFGDDYKEELISYLEKVYLMMDEDSRGYDMTIENLTRNVLLILGYDFSKKACK